MNIAPAPLPRPFRGIIPPLVTPLLETGQELDPAGLERLIEHVLAGGVQGVFILGTTGEGPGLDGRLKRELIHRACRLVRGRVPVLAAISDTACEASVALADFAAEAGVSAVVATPPFYFPMDQAELLGHLERLAARLPLPLFLYNMPSCVRTVFEPETVRAAADIPGILGLKDSSGNMAYFKKLLALLQDRPAFTLLTGPEELLAESVQAGGHGGVTGGANLFPSLYAGLYQAAAAGDRVRVNDLHARVMTISRNLYTVGTKSSSYLRGVKCALACLGICGDAMAEPFRPFSESKRQIIRERLEQATASLYPPL